MSNQSHVSCLFCINAGRSGSDYLSRIFEAVPECEAFHEFTPIGNSIAMRRFAHGDTGPIKHVAAEKVKQIEKARRSDKLYVETNHCFINGFGWLLPQKIPEKDIGIIILTREKAKVIESRLRVGATPITRKGREWLPPINKKDPLVTPPNLFGGPTVSFWCAYVLNKLLNWWIRKLWKLCSIHVSKPQWLARYEHRCLSWYMDEIAAMSKLFQDRFRHIQYYQIDIEELNDLTKVEQMLSYFGLQSNDTLQQVVGEPSNLKPHKYLTSLLW